nr:hypothetical protein [Tanacetum cinerariifolium]
MTIDMTIDQQLALDEALVPHESRLRIGKSKFSLRSDITSKESTLQVVYDVLRLTSFYKAFLVTADVPEIYMQGFWETAIVYHHSIHFKMNNKKHIINLENFRAKLHIYFVYQVEQKDAKKSNEMYYPRFTKVIMNFFMTKDPSIPRRNKVNWHYVRDDQMFTTIKLVLRHQNTQQFGAMLPVELTNEDIKTSAAYKEYYAIASGAAPPKTKVSVKKTQSSSNPTIPPPMAAGTRLSTLVKGKQHAKLSKAKDLSVLSEVALTEAEQIKLATKTSLQQTISLKLVDLKPSDKDDDDDVDDQSDADDDDDDDDQKDEDEKDDDYQDDNDDYQDSDNDGDDIVHPKLSTHEEEAKDEESFDPIVQTPSQVEKSDDESSDDESHGMNVGGEEGPDAEDNDEELYKDVNINMEGRDIQMIDVYTTQVLEDTHVTLTLDLLNFGSLFGFDHYLKTLEANFSEFMQKNQFAEAVSFNLGIVDRYIDHWMHKAVKVAVQLLFDRLQEEAQAKNEDLLNKLDENIQKITKEQVNVQVYKILPNIEKTVNEQLEAEDLTRSSNSSKTSYDVIADLSEMELKKILIEKMESHKSIILDTYGYIVTLKRRRDDADKDEEPSVGSDRGSKRRREGKEPELISAPKEQASKTAGKSTEGKADQSYFRRTLCFQRLFKNVHEKHSHPTACRKSSIRKIHTLAVYHVKESLLKLNLLDHRTLKDGGKGTCFQLSQRFIAACSYPTINDEVLKLKNFKKDASKSSQVIKSRKESTIPLNEIVSQIPPSIVITTSPLILPIEDPKDPLIMRDEDFSIITEKESNKVIQSSVDDLVPIPSESEDTSGSDSEYDLSLCDDLSPINYLEGNSVTFSNTLFDSNDDFSSSDDELLSDEDVPKDKVKIYLNPLFEFDDEYISSGDVNEIELLLHHDPSTLRMSVASILEGFTDEPSLEENDDLFDLESKENKWKKILYDAPINDLMTEDKVFDPEILEKIFSPTYVSLPFEDAIILIKVIYLLNK